MKMKFGLQANIALWDPGSMKFSPIIEQSSRDWETTVCQYVALTVSHTQIHVIMSRKLSEPHLEVLLFSNPGEKVWNAKETMEQICPTFFLHFMTFSPQLETNNALQCRSDSFPHMVLYILCVEIVRTTFRRIVVYQSRGDCSIMWENCMDPGYQSATYLRWD